VALAVTASQSEALEVLRTSRPHQQDEPLASPQSQRHPAVREGLLQSVDGHDHAQRHLDKDSRGPLGPDFFTDDTPVGADENPPGYLQGKVAGKGPCHPTCHWTCGESHCNKNCTPVCKAPLCMTRCQKPKISQCKQICEDPKCAVVCPPGPFTQCTGNDCPTCQTVCGRPHCRLDCGQGRLCSSTCADPVCAFRCDRQTCPEPMCKMHCDTHAKSCGLTTPTPTLRDVYAGRGGDTLDGHRNPAAEYAGREVGWTGLAKVPSNQLMRGATWPFKPYMPGGAQMFGGPLPPEGPKPYPKNPCASFCKKPAAAAPAPAPAPAPGQGSVAAPAAKPCECKYQGKTPDLDVSHINWAMPPE